MQLLALPAWGLSEENKASLVALYEGFVRDFAAKLNQRRLAQLILVVAPAQPTPEGELAFLVESLGKVGGDQEALLCLDSARAKLLLAAGEVKACKSLLGGAETLLESLSDAEALTHSSFYDALAQCLKAQADSEGFFRASLQYLSYTPMASLQPEQQQSLAFEIGRAALVGPKLYSFGELLTHPVLASLEGTSQAWMPELLKAFNSGDVSAYESATKANAAAIAAQSDLASHEAALRQKIYVLALMAMAFSRPADARSLTFADIASTTQLQTEDEVEFLVMKAMSLGLVRGEIDQIAQAVSVTWVAPRVLTGPQLKVLGERLQQWSNETLETLTFVEANSAA